jgi:Tfp pilus assembly protein PilV
MHRLHREAGRERTRGRMNPAAEAGMTLVELLVTSVILVIVVGGLATLFVSAIRSETDQTNRVRSQQNARVVLDQLRREIHCASTVSSNLVNAGDPSWPAKSITIKLGSYCTTNSAGLASITWCTSASPPYTLWRYGHKTDLSAATYATACKNAVADPAGRQWAANIVDVSGSVSSGQIFTGYSAPTQPAMPTPVLTLGATAGTLGSALADSPYGYVVDPVTAAGEQPGSEATVRLAQGTVNRSITVDWSGSCPPYSGITGYKVYGRTVGGEGLLTTISETTCATTSYVDTGATTPAAGSPVAAILATVSVDIPVRVSNTGLTELTDNITLRNTPR